MGFLPRSRAPAPSPARTAGPPPRPAPAQAAPPASPGAFTDPAPAPGGASGELLDRLTQIAAAVDAVRAAQDASERRLDGMEDRVSAIATLAEALTAVDNPFAESPGVPTRTLVPTPVGTPSQPPAPAATPAGGQGPVPPGPGSGTAEALLPRIAPGVAPDILCYQWAGVLVTAVGREGAVRALQEYGRVGWLGDAAIETLARYVGAAAEAGRRTGLAPHPDDLGRASRHFIERLAGGEGPVDRDAPTVPVAVALPSEGRRAHP